MLSTVWAVVVHYNGEPWIEKCLRSLLESTRTVTVAVIDNASTRPQGLQLIEEKFAGQVKLVRNSENIGFGRANNQGMRMALDDGADFVLLLNQDAWVFPDTVEKLIAASTLHPEYGILSPVHLDASGTVLDHGFAHYLQAGGITETAVLTAPALTAIVSLPFVNAAAWLLTRPCLEEVGGFGPVFFMYGEDLDYCHRCRYHGQGIGVVLQSKICHARDQKRPANRKFTDGERHKMRGFLLSVLTDINRPFVVQLPLFAIHLFKYIERFRYGNAMNILLAGLRLLMEPKLVLGYRGKSRIENKYRYIPNKRRKAA